MCETKLNLSNQRLLQSTIYYHSLPSYNDAESVMRSSYNEARNADSIITCWGWDTNLLPTTRQIYQENQVIINESTGLVATYKERVRSVN